jgi:hypothetical protein
MTEVGWLALAVLLLSLGCLGTYVFGRNVGRMQVLDTLVRNQFDGKRTFEEWQTWRSV